MIEENVFDSKAECIVNTINCVGFMGKGLALEFALRYPKLEEIYKKECAAHQIHTGVVYFYTVDGQKIINFPTKFHFKYPSQMEWIVSGLDNFVQNYKSWNIKSIAFPLLGSRNGGLDPDEVINLIKTKLSPLDLDVMICLNKKPDRLSTQMLELFNASKILLLSERFNLNKNQTIELQKAQNKIKRFDELLEIKSIGLTTYKKLFDYFRYYKPETEQLSLF